VPPLCATLWSGDKPVFSSVGVTLLALSIALMLWLARAKQRLAHELGSEALEADAFQTTACWWLSLARSRQAAVYPALAHYDESAPIDVRPTIVGQEHRCEPTSSPSETGRAGQCIEPHPDDLRCVPRSRDAPTADTCSRA